MEKRLNFANRCGYSRRQTAYGTLPFRQGEWSGEQLVAFNGDELVACTVTPFGKPYSDGSYRYGAALVKLEMSAWENQVIRFVEPQEPVGIEPFRFSRGASSFSSSMLFVSFRDGSGNLRQHILGDWEVIEDGMLRKVFQSRQRIDRDSNLVCDFKLYLCSREDLTRFEMRIIGSNPDNTLHSYPVTELKFGVLGEGFVHIQNMPMRGGRADIPYKSYVLVEDGYFGDGQSLCYHGELLLPNFGDADYLETALAEINWPLRGMSPDWRECQEAYGVFGIIPEPLELPDGGEQFITRWATEQYQYLQHEARGPWEDYRLGLTAVPGQAGTQRDFGLIEGWETFYLGYPELVEAYYNLAQEEAKRPGHYMESDGSPVKHANHPLWVVWDGVTHYHFGVSVDRLGKTVSGPRPNNGVKGKDWQHHSSNLLHMATLLTGSYMLIDECNTEVELWLAGRTDERRFPRASTNGLDAPRGFGRPQVSMLQHDLVLNRPVIIERSLDVFRYNITPKWPGGQVNGPVKVWQILRNDPRVLGELEAWSGWNETLGWIGMAALYHATGNPDVKHHMQIWGHSILNYGWRYRPDTTFDNLALRVGYAIWLKPDGAPLTDEEYNDPRYYKSGGEVTIWGIPLLVYVKDSEDFSQEDRNLAREMLDKMNAERRSGQIKGNPAAAYNGVYAPFDEIGRWMAIKP